MTRRKSHAPLRVMPTYQKHHAPLSIPLIKYKIILIKENNKLKVKTYLILNYIYLKWDLNIIRII